MITAAHLIFYSTTVMNDALAYKLMYDDGVFPPSLHSAKPGLGLVIASAANLAPRRDSGSTPGATSSLKRCRVSPRLCRGRPPACRHLLLLRPRVQGQ